MKVDIEGGEADALRGGARLLREGRPYILVSTHGPTIRDDVESTLHRAGYQYRTIDREGRDLLAWHPAGPNLSG